MSYRKCITLVSGECVLGYSAVTTGLVYSLEAMWTIRSQTRVLYANSLSYLVRNKEKKGINIHHWKWIFGCEIIHDEGVPCDQLDKVVVEGDASAGIKDGGVSVAVEVCGDDLQKRNAMLLRILINKTV